MQNKDVLKNWVCFLIGFICFHITSNSLAQVQCPAMSCHNQVNVSVDANCEFLFTSDIFLQGDTLLQKNDPSASFLLNIESLQIEDFPLTGIGSEATEAWRSDALFGVHQFSIENDCGNTCWGTIVIESKLPPEVINHPPNFWTFACSEIDWVLHHDDYTGSYNLNPKLSENCAGLAEELLYKDQYTEGGSCEDGNTCIRTWYVKRANYNNPGLYDHELYKQVFTFTTIDPQDVECPKSNFIIPCEVSTDPDSIYAYFKSVDSDSAAVVNAFPHINTGRTKLGIVLVDSVYFEEVILDTIFDNVWLNGEWEVLPVVIKEVVEHRVKVEKEKQVPVIIPLREGKHFCNILASKEDYELPICGNDINSSRKVFRTWKIIDWCEETTIFCDQVFEVKDTLGPEIIEWPHLLEYGIDPWYCTASIEMPEITVQDQCSGSDMTYEMEMMDTTSLEFMPMTDQKIGHNIPVGTYWMYLTAVDHCGNRSKQKKTLCKVRDYIEPVPLCGDDIVVTLADESGIYGDGLSEISAAAFDNGSHDSRCNEVFFKVLRQDEMNAAGSIKYGHPIACEAADSIIRHYDKFGQIVEETEVVYFDDFVTFCCTDTMVNVVLRIFDQDPGEGPVAPYNYHGNFSDCHIQVRIKKQQPKLKQCAPVKYIQCMDDIHNMTIMGQPILEQGCSYSSLLYSDHSSNDETCGSGRIARSWYVDMNANGQIDHSDQFMCHQEIFIQATIFDPTSIKWPRHYDGKWLSGIRKYKEADTEICEEERFEIKMGDPISCVDELEFCKPEWSDVACGLVGFNVDTDTLFVDGSQSCAKIIKRWTIIDWCHFEANQSEQVEYNSNIFEPVLDECDRLGCIAENDHGSYIRYIRTVTNDGRDSAAISWDGYYTYEQVIKIIDETNPVLDEDNTVRQVVNSSDCYGDVQIAKHAEDSACGSILQWEVTIRNSAGYIVANQTATGSDFNWILPDVVAGTYQVDYIVRDACNNKILGSDTYILEDGYSPVPYCISDIATATMSSDGSATIWARDFNLGSADQCTEDQNLRYTFSDVPPEEDPNFSDDDKSASLTISCNDLEEGAHEMSLDMYVWDESGNYDFCSVTINIQNENNDCSPSESAMISGYVYSPQNEMIDEVEVRIIQATEQPKKQLTDQSGSFAFRNNDMLQNYIIQAEKNIDHLNGVSTLDLVLIQQHILGTSPLQSPYKMIAADVNNDQRVSASDIVELRKMILGDLHEFSNNQSWRFMDAHQNLTSSQDPWPFLEVLTIQNLQKDMTDQNLIGIKIGDVSGNAVANRSKSVMDHFDSQINITYDDQYYRVGEIIQLELSMAHSEQILGFQFALDHKGITVEDVTSTVPEFDFGHYKIGKYDTKISWSDPIGTKASRSIVTLTGTANKEGYLSEWLSLDSKIIPAEIYSNSPTEAKKLMLSINQMQDQQGSFELMQNHPNPFTIETQIECSVDAIGNYQLKIFDHQGKLMYEAEHFTESKVLTFRIGPNEIGDQLGVFYYQLSNESMQVTKKMVRVR